MTPFVSIVVVSYNQAQFIEECLGSIKNQTFENWELIVADDASHDSSKEVFENWLNKNQIKAKKIYHQNNTGLATVLNEATELCEGKYVKFIAADDFLHPEYFEKTVNKLEELGEEYGLIFTNANYVDENSYIDSTNLEKKYATQFNDPEFCRNKLLEINYIIAPSVLMRKQALLDTGVYKEEYLCEDYFRWLKISKMYKFAYQQKVLTYYRRHDQNITVTKKDRINEEDLLLKISFDENGLVRNQIKNKLI